MDLPSSRNDALAIGAKRFFTGKPCKHGHVSPQYTNGGNCVECKRIAKNKYRENNIERLREYDREYVKRNAIRRKENTARWKKNNPEKRSIYRSKRRASERNALPHWLSENQGKEIGKIYALAKWMSAVIDADFHVDHIFPMASDFMCGLHVPENLIVLSSEDNLSKNNTWWPGQLECQMGRGKSHEWWRDAMQKAREDF